MLNKTKLIANMVAKNESSRYLHLVLGRLETYVSTIVFTDDCSTDETPLVAEDMYNAKVAQTPEPLFEKDEHALRSFAWEHLSHYANPGDWILAIDADEVLYNTNLLPTMLDQTRYDAFGITFFHMWSPSSYRVDKAWAPSPSVRLFRYFQGGEYRNRALACGSVPTYVDDELKRHDRVLMESPLFMKHLGYMFDDDKLMKHKRYMTLDGGKYHSLRHLESILDENPTLAEWPYD